MLSSLRTNKVLVVPVVDLKYLFKVKGNNRYNTTKISQLGIIILGKLN